MGGKIELSGRARAWLAALLLIPGYGCAGRASEARSDAGAAGSAAGLGASGGSGAIDAGALANGGMAGAPPCFGVDSGGFGIAGLACFYEGDLCYSGSTLCEMTCTCRRADAGLLAWDCSFPHCVK